MNAAQKKGSDGTAQGTCANALIRQPRLSPPVSSTSLTHYYYWVGAVRSKFLFCSPHLHSNSFHLVLLKLVFLGAVQAAQ